jgi:hypothetical protein
MALPLLRVSGDGADDLWGTLWGSLPGAEGRARGRKVAIWPLWDSPLDLDAVRVLIEHPALRTTTDDPALRALGVFRLSDAQRRLEGRIFRGVLAPYAPTSR